ncbi:MAG: hypothetical protein HY303_08770 [Candidatus Wallbacteria bacterium]|nr:hypothetical protein [Candidatus Wallbacteria bacterium]
MSEKLALAATALLLYGAMLYRDLAHPESILSRTDRPPPARAGASAATRTPALAIASLDLAAPRKGRFEEPVRDVFDYKEAAPRAAPPPPPPPPPPAPVLALPPRRLRRESIVVHGVYERKDPPARKVFLSLDDRLCVVESGDELLGGLRVKAIGPAKITIQTIQGDEEEVFDLP